MAKKRPDWFQSWLDNDFNHLALEVKTNKRLTALLIALVAATFIRVFIG